MRIALIVNPAAGRGQGATAGRRAASWLIAQGVGVDVFAGDSASDTRALCGRALETRPDAVAVVGGDGTLAGIVDLIADAGVPVVLIPAGTGNDLARALEIDPEDAERAASAAIGGVAQGIDLGVVESGGISRSFLTVAALGFDARVADRTNRLRHPRGPLRYYVALLLELATLRPTLFRVRLDDGPERAMPGTLLAAGSTESYGGGMPICRGADPADGLLDVVHVAPLSRSRLVRLFPLLLRGAHLGRPEVTHTRVRSVTVSAPDLVVYADGESVATGECRITVRPSALTVLVPRA